MSSDRGCEIAKQKFRTSTQFIHFTILRCLGSSSKFFWSDVIPVWRWFEGWQHLANIWSCYKRASRKCWFLMMMREENSIFLRCFQIVAAPASSSSSKLSTVWRSCLVRISEQQRRQRIRTVFNLEMTSSDFLLFILIFGNGCAYGCVKFSR